MRIIGCVSTWEEGPLIVECVRSLLPAVDFVLVYEGPFSQPGVKATYPEDISLDRDLAAEVKRNRIIVRTDSWENQARKLTEMTHRVASFGKKDEPVWALHLDGDEVLLWGQFLPDIIRRFTEALPNERWMNIKLVEMDGTVGGTQTHLIRADLVESYFVSGSQILFKGDSFPIALYNPDGDRFPIQGEPHILHRSALRSQGRDDPNLRVHKSEEDAWFIGQERKQIG